MFHFELTGMILSRTSSVAPWREMARRICCGRSASFLIIGARPDVEMVMWRAPMFMPQWPVMMSRAFSRFLMLASGSPMPMKTMLLIFLPDSSSTAMSWPTISSEVRFLASPASPDAQNLQPYAQPTWDETQAVRRSALSP